MSAAAKVPGPMFNTPEWHAARDADMRRLADRSRYRQPPRYASPFLASMRAELARLAVREATFNERVTHGGVSIGQRMFELQQQIRAEELRTTDTTEGAVSVVNPEGGRTSAAIEGTEETGADRPAAPISQRYAAHAVTAASARVPGEDDDL